jgi:hypothetical protein
LKQAFALFAAMVVSLTCTATHDAAKFRRKPLFSGCKGMATGAEWQKNGHILKEKNHISGAYLVRRTAAG